LLLGLSQVANKPQSSSTGEHHSGSSWNRLFVQEPMV
jgi:hypothetical protein